MLVHAYYLWQECEHLPLQWTSLHTNNACSHTLLLAAWNADPDAAITVASTEEGTAGQQAAQAAMQEAAQDESPRLSHAFSIERYQGIAEELDVSSGVEEGEACTDAACTLTHHMEACTHNIRARTTHARVHARMHKLFSMLLATLP